MSSEETTIELTPDEKAVNASQTKGKNVGRFSIRRGYLTCWFASYSLEYLGEGQVQVTLPRLNFTLKLKGSHIGKELAISNFDDSTRRTIYNLLVRMRTANGMSKEKAEALVKSTFPDVVLES